jgi:SecD/SecF fusion protein
MQNIKGAIRIFAILMALSCIFYLSFSFVTRSWEKKADSYATAYLSSKEAKDIIATAGGNKQREQKIADSLKELRVRYFLDDSIAGKDIYLNYFTYQQCKEKELSLGLDLQGGMNVTLEVFTPEIVTSLSGNSTDPAFTQAMALAIERDRTSNEDFVTLFGTAYAEKNPQGRLSSYFASTLKDDNITYNSTNEQVLAAIRKEANNAVDRAKLVLETRINKFGVAQPNIQKLESSNRIIVELPGVKDKSRVRKLIQGSANLEFWETYNMGEIAQSLVDANERLKIVMGIKDSTKVDSAAYTPKYENAKTTEDSVNARDAAKKLGDSIRKADSIKEAADTTKKKNERNPLFERFQPNFPQQGVPDGPIVGYAGQKDTAYVMSLFRNPEVARILPSDLRLAWDFKARSNGNGTPYYSLIALKAGRGGRAAMQGDVITNSRKQTSQQSAGYEISMSMNASGTSEWARITRKNVGKSIAIVLDNNVYSYPNVNQEITGGVSQITGNFQSQDADDLVNVLNTGKLPARARIVEETVVGPSLGKEAVRSGLLSFAVALLVVLLYMAFYYSRAGWVAGAALFVNVFFIVGILASLGAVLTLPGIAGVILTIALSVDANILIFERIREELREGKGLGIAVADGYKHAMSSILDSNLTTLILGIILYAFGSGPVQGFATTLIIGILSSLFCAIFITRMIFDGMLKRDAKITFSVPATEHVLVGKNFDFVGKRRFFYMISGLIITVGVIFFFKNGGFRLGVDFSGGRTYTVAFNDAANTDAVRQALTPEFGTTPEVKTAGGNNQLKITTNFMSSDISDKADSLVKLKLANGLNKAVGSSDNYELVGSSQVGPSIAKDVVNRSYVVIIASCVLMFLFILFRFRKWQFGLGAVAALLHDVLMVLSFFVIFEGIVPFALEIDQHFVAAILTVMAYSMTDTVVVFDRIREFLTGKGSQMRGAEQRKLINYALNSTLSRTINTSMITFFVLLAIFIFGGDTIRGFSFALVIGIVIGTYSSLCIATPIVVDFDRSKDEGEEPVKVKA